MTIKEAESRAGLARANIRYYEEQGFFSPARGENGYRDYSEEDARTLEKIKLLRQLQLDIDTIRKVQQGTLTLEQAVFVQTTRLEGDKALIERAAEVCRGIEASGVEYAALEPRPWLAQLQAPPQPSLPSAPPAAPEEEALDEWDFVPKACYHPWQRLFARALDMALYRVIFGWLLAVLFWNMNLLLTTGVLSWLLDLALLGFTLAVEPLWLHYLGWTPGKLLFGLKVRNKDGEKLTIAQGFERSWDVFRDGYGWNIPFWDLWKMWQCRKLGLEGQDCWWDTDYCFHYTKEERRFNTGVVYILLALACSGLLWLAIELTDLPRNRGDLTVAEFCQNYNQYRDRFEFDNVPKLDREGQWDEREQNNNVVSHSGSVSYSSSDGTSRVIENVVEGTTVWPPLEFTMEDGRVTAVTLRMESQDSIIGGSVIREYLALAAMSGAADGQDMFHFEPLDGLFEMSGLDYFEDLELDYWGLHISQRVEYEGYNSVGGSMWETEEDGPRHFERTLTISLSER